MHRLASDNLNLKKFSELWSKQLKPFRHFVLILKGDWEWTCLDWYRNPVAYKKKRAKAKNTRKICKYFHFHEFCSFKCVILGSHISQSVKDTVKIYRWFFIWSFLAFFSIILSNFYVYFSFSSFFIFWFIYYIHSLFLHLYFYFKTFVLLIIWNIF